MRLPLKFDTGGLDYWKQLQNPSKLPKNGRESSGAEPQLGLMLLFCLKLLSSSWIRLLSFI